MIWDAYRAIREKGDGSYETDGYLIIDHMGEGLCKVDEYGSYLTCLGSRFEQAGTISPGRYAIGDCFPNDGRAYVLMADTDMEDLLFARKALDRLNRMERREWGAESQGLTVSFFVRSFSGGKVRIADFTREGRMELRSAHSTLVRHFVGAVGREGIHAPMGEPERMSEEMYERIGRCLWEIAGKYGFLCGKESSGLWYLGIQETGFIQRVLLRIKRERAPSDCIMLSGEAHEIMREYIQKHPAFSQEDAWSLTDDLNGLCGRMAPPVIPLDKTGNRTESPGIRISDLFPLKVLTALPHAPDGKPVTAWDVRQAALRGTDTYLRDTLIGFLRNIDNVMNAPDAVVYLSEMAARCRLDTVREISEERLREITGETLLRAVRSKEPRIIRRGAERNSHIAHVLSHRANEEKLMIVAEDEYPYGHVASREMAR